MRARPPSRHADRAGALLQTELDFGLAMLKQGRIDGMVFVATDMVDLPLKGIEQIRTWVRKHGDTTLPDRAERFWPR